MRRRAGQLSAEDIIRLLNASGRDVPDNAVIYSFGSSGDRYTIALLNDGADRLIVGDCPVYAQYAITLVNVE